MNNSGKTNNGNTVTMLLLSFDLNIKVRTEMIGGVKNNGQQKSLILTSVFPNRDQVITPAKTILATKPKVFTAECRLTATLGGMDYPGEVSIPSEKMLEKIGIFVVVAVVGLRLDTRGLWENWRFTDWYYLV